jgi:hypothetical protein
VQIVRTEAWWLRARILLACAGSSSNGRRHGLADVTRIASKLDKERVCYASVWAALLRAGVAAREGDQSRAVDALGMAIAEAQAAEMSLCAAAAQRRLGELLRGTQGAELLLEADRRLASLGVAAPAKMVEVIAPGWY